MNAPSSVQPVEFLGLRIPGATLADIERVTILETFQACGRSSHRTAAVLGVSVRKIQYRLKEYRAKGLLAP